MSEKEVRKVCNSLILASTQWKLAVAQGRCEPFAAHELSSAMLQTTDGNSVTSQL